MTLVEILQGTHVALQILQARIVLVLCMALTFVIFAWALVLQTQLGCILAAAWALLVFLPVLYTGGRHGIEAQHKYTDEAGSQPGRSAARAA